jgi:hypothetical protein
MGEGARHRPNAAVTKSPSRYCTFKWGGTEAREVLAFSEAAYESSAQNASVRL